MAYISESSAKIKKVMDGTVNDKSAPTMTIHDFCSERGIRQINEGVFSMFVEKAGVRIKRATDAVPVAALEMAHDLFRGKNR